MMLRTFKYTLTRTLVSVIANFFFVCNAFALVPNEIFSDVQLRNLVENERGFLKNTSNDGHIILSNMMLTREQMCGVIFSIEFENTPLKPSLFDVYWRTSKHGFREGQKATFIISHQSAVQKNQYLLPMCKLYGFSGNVNSPEKQANVTGFRIDYPANKDLSLKITDLAFTDSKSLSDIKNTIVLEPYERVSAKSFASFDVVIPKLIFAFEEGLKRMTADKLFLVFWLFLIFVLKCLVLLSFMRQLKSNDK